MVRIDAQSDVPVFQQIGDDIKAAIARGAYRPGEAIPSVRGLAADILVNPNTVARAYRELEREGVVEMRRGKGLYVTEDALMLCRRDRLENVLDKVSELVAEARQAGMPMPHLLELVKGAIGGVEADAGTAMDEPGVGKDE